MAAMMTFSFQRVWVPGYANRDLTVDIKLPTCAIFVEKPVARVTFGAWVFFASMNFSQETLLFAGQTETF